MLTIRDFWRHGAMRGIESTAARRAIAEARERWLSILEACVERDEDGVDEHVHAEIRRLRRLLGLQPAASSPEMMERRRQQVRDRVRRFRERQANEALIGPRRVQLRRTPGWRKPSGAVKVDRTTKWGNPIKVPKHLRKDPVFLAGVVAEFRASVLSPERTGIWKNYPPVTEIATLRGKELMCWCPLHLPCHADVLLELASQ